MILDVLAALLRGGGPRGYAVQLWDGRVLPPEAGRVPEFTVVVRTPAVFLRLLSRPNVATLGEAYMRGDIEVRGALEASFAVADRLLDGWSTLRRLAGAWPRRHGTKQRMRGAVNFHYDLPQAFFRAWLDPRMVYSCAYFRQRHDSLDAAQEQKLEHVCNKLLLRPGQRFLDVGCGWGALILHAAERHGVDATGITLSSQQAAVAEERIARAGLSGRCRVRVADYRDLPQAERFDRIASVGMIEHVPLTLQKSYFATIHRLLGAGGLALSHGITRTATKPLGGGNAFLRRHVFPGHEIVPLTSSLAMAEGAGFEIRDVENLREHYDITLTRWFERLEASKTELERLVEPEVVRAFELYLVGMAHHFRRGNLQIHQTLLAKPAAGEAGLPLTRRHLHANELLRDSSDCQAVRSL